MRSETSRMLIVTKFIFLILELIITITATVERHSNIMMGMRPMPMLSEYDSATTHVVAFGTLCIIFQTFELILNMAAMNIHFDKLNSVLCIYHFIGFGCFFFYLFDRWHYYSLMYLWIVFCLIPLIFEIIIGINGFHYYGIYESYQLKKKRKQRIDEENKKKELEERQRQENEHENDEELQQLQPNEIQ